MFQWDKISLFHSTWIISINCNTSARRYTWTVYFRIHLPRMETPQSAFQSMDLWVLRMSIVARARYGNSVFQYVVPGICVAALVRYTDCDFPSRRGKKIKFLCSSGISRTNFLFFFRERIFEQVRQRCK